MAAEGADVTLLVPRVFCPPWLRAALGKPANYDHTVQLVDFDGIDAIPVPYLGLPGLWFNRWSGLSAFLSMRRLAAALHREREFDVIYATELFLSGDAARRLAASLDLPAACLAIGGDVNVTAKATNALRNHFERVVNQLNGMLACGEGIAEEIRKKRSHNSTICVQGVVDLEKFRPRDDTDSLRQELQLPNDRTLILYVGYLWVRKGLLELIEAFQEVHAESPNAYLLICGAGDEELTIRAAAERSPASGKIQFLGNVDPDEIHRFMQASDLFVLPSHAEGMPNAVMEAMACGLPTVCTSVGGIPAAIGDSQGALLVPPHDSGALAAALGSVLADSDRRHTMGVHARALAENQFGARRNARKILDYLSKEVVDR